MNPIKPLDFRLLEDLFDTGRGAGYVMDFSDKTFREFFADALNVDIDDSAYAREGSSKGKRLRCFLRTVDVATASMTLRALWEYREGLRQHLGKEEWVTNAEGRFLDLLDRLNGGQGPGNAVGAPPVPAFPRERYDHFKARIVEIHALAPQPRGYAFEKLLTELFTSFGLAPREPFRLRGEQIDGSFVLQSQIYLVEAKWQEQACGAADLHAFHGKIDQKADWTRGVFISYNGFTADGLHAFGRAKKLVCVNGYDLWESMSREIPIPHLLERKVRGAGESGRPYIDIRELFP